MVLEEKSLKLQPMGKEAMMQVPRKKEERKKSDTFTIIN
jgi:hypothetical protein